jgi:hypothetical protein
VFGGEIVQAKLLEKPMERGPSRIFFEIGWESGPRCFYVVIHRLVLALFFKKKEKKFPSYLRIVK